MADTIEQTYSTDFTAALTHAAQQKRSLLIDTMTMPGKKLVGEKIKAIEFLEPGEAERVTGRHQASNPREGEFEQRWLVGHRYRRQLMVDKLDKLNRVSDPTDAYVQNIRMGLFRAADRQEIIPAFFGTAKTGEDGSGTTPWPADAEHEITAAGNSAAQYLAAFAEALQSLEDAEVSVTDEEVFAVIPPAVKRVLFGDVQVTSGDYHPNRPGLIESYMLPPMYGINWRVHTGITVPGSGNIEVPLYTRAGMYFGEWDEIEGFVDRRPGYNHDWQISGYHTMGATRVDEDRVRKVKLPIPA